MGNFFQVDLDVLQRMTKTLSDAGDQMEAALKSMNSAHSGQIGDDVINRAADDFQNTWQYGLGQLQQLIKDTSDGVNKCHDAYKQCDDAVGNAMQQINGEAMGKIDTMVSAATVHGAAK